MKFGLGRTYRGAVFNGTTFTFPPGSITMQLGGVRVSAGSITFPASVPIIVPSDGSEASAGIGPGSWGFGAAIDNSSAYTPDGKVFCGVDLTGLPKGYQGNVIFSVENSADSGVSWPDPGTSVRLPPFKVFAGKPQLVTLSTALLQQPPTS
jgi:hypothetical protein